MSENPIKKNEINLPKPNRFLDWLLASIAVLSLLVNIILTWKTGFPESNIKIIDMSLSCDDRVVNDNKYLDSLYLYLRGPLLIQKRGLSLRTPRRGSGQAP
jgi:hypothetical protein